MAILQKQASDVGKPANKVTLNYCNVIADQFAGLITSNPVTYENIDDELLDVLFYNDDAEETSNVCLDLCRFGCAYEILYFDEEGKIRYKMADPRQMVPLYDDTLDQTLKFVVRFWQTNLIEENQPVYTVEVYSDKSVKTYQSGPGFASFNLIDEKPNFFDQVPVCCYALGQDAKSVFDQVMSINDAINSLYSDGLDTQDSFSDAYLVLTGQFADEEQLASMKQHRCLMLDEGSKAEFLTKDIHNTAFTEMLEDLDKQIWSKAQCVNYQDEAFGTSSGIALKFKMLAMLNKAGFIEQQMKKGLQKRLEVIVSGLTLVDAEKQWREAKIVFTENVPTNDEDLLNLINSLRDVVSKETLLGMIPFVDDVEAEMKRIEAENDFSTYEGLNHDAEEILGRA